MLHAEEAEDGADAILGTQNLAAWDAWFRSNAPELGFCPSDFAYGIAEAAPADGAAAIDALSALARSSWKPAAAKLALYLGLAVLAAMLQGIAPDSPVAETARLAFRAGAASAVLLSVGTELRGAADAIRLANDTAELLLPVLLGVLTLGGMENSAAAVAGTFSLYASVAVQVMRRVVLPLACVGCVLCALDAGETPRLSSIGQLMLRGAKWALGALGTVFGLFGAVRGAAAASADGYLLRTVKLAAGSLPAVGGMIGGSAEAVYQCLMLAKNAIGLCGVTLVLLLAAKPVMTLWLSRCALRAARALSEPLAGKPYAVLLHALSDTLFVLLLTELAAFGLLALSVSPLLRVGGFS